ncbi:MAG: cysteine desulfurase [Streptococcaceae bacterium]|jgi:cysteine desulfurase/selenocysteine lyase|nr:cysteine desulfurase [Streptococcaceae bacterium]
MSRLDPYEVKKNFKILQQKINDEPLIYLDNAATTQKPQQVLDAINHYYKWENANVHRGVHTLAERATSSYEKARAKVRKFLNASDTSEIIFTRGTTTSLNMVAQSFGEAFLKAKDEIVISVMEHHANIIPWQELAKRKGLTLKYIELKNGELDVKMAQNLITDKTKIVSLTHISNVLGVENPVKELIDYAHNKGAIFVLDAAQSLPHQRIDVQALDVDFLAFSGHKMLGPTGIGVLFGKRKFLEVMEPVEFGGEMIDFVYRNTSTLKELPWKFEAGTPNIAGAIGLDAAIQYLQRHDFDAIKAHEKELVEYLFPKLQAINSLMLYGPEEMSKHTGILSFNIDGLHPHDVATALDMQGIAVRAGHLCAQPLIKNLNVSALVRASFYIYNTKKDCEKLVDAIIAVKEFFSHGPI